jgi:Calcium binding
MPNRKKKTMPQFGKQPPQYRFFLNPYQDVRFTSCPQCDSKMRQRKLPLVIHIDPIQLLSLNKTCRYCPHCDLLIAHQDDVEHVLASIFTQRKPEIVGNDYLVVGTLEKIVDETYSTIVAVKHKHGVNELPLCDLKATEADTETRQLVEDYAVWFANR